MIAPPTPATCRPRATGSGARVAVTMLPRLLPSRAPAALLDPVVRLLAALRVTPNALSVAGLAGAAAAAALIANGALPAGGALLLLAGSLDLLDGALARATGRAGPAGALLDSTLDRCSEAAVLFGVLLYQLGRDASEEAALAFAAVTGSLLVSYVRARAEGLGAPLADGLLRRQERVVLLAAGLLTGWLRLALWLLAVLTLLTVLQRLRLGLRAVRAQAADGGER